MTSPCTVEVPAQIQRGAHACWAYQDERDLARTAVTFLSEGRRLGEHLLFVGEGTQAELVGLLAGLADRDELITMGRLEVLPLFDVYAREGALDPSAQVNVLRRAREAALAGGATGLRIAAEISGLARGGPDWERGLQAYERDVCELFDGPDLTALCLYDGALGGILGPLTLLHPVRGRVTEESAVHLRSLGQGLALHGELDLVDAGDVLAALTVIAETTESDMRLDLSELSFLDVAGARSLALAAGAFRRHGHHLQLAGARPVVRRCLDLFGFDQDGA